MSRPGRVIAAALAGSVSLAVVGLAGIHGVAALHAGERLAQRTDRQTAAVDVQIALGRYAASHRRAEEAAAVVLDRALPDDVEDRTILAAVVSATSASGTVLADEARGQPETAPAGMLRVPVTLDVNASTIGALVHLAQNLQHQPRLISVSSLELTTAGGDSLHVSASVFVADAAPIPAAARPG